MSPVGLFLLGFIACFIPILAWLWFLEHEDKNPEPFRLTIQTFIAGMVAVIIVIPFEKVALSLFGNNSFTIVIWAAIEELAKLCAATFIALRRAENDEPIDSMMYMIATALGFALLENTLFVFRPLLDSNFSGALLIGNYRFLGATILHVVASTTIGASLALAYYKDASKKHIYLFCGVILAIALHAAFNLSIIYFDDSKSAIPFFGVWIVFVGILLAFERVKQITKFNN